MRSLIVALVAACAPMCALGAPTVQGVASVIDGDTIEIHGKHIRLFGIDSPEKGQTCLTSQGTPWRCGQKAALALSDWLGHASISCEQKDIDRYKRFVAICHKGSEDIGAWMVSNGWALDYRHYSSLYLDEEASAKAGKRNMWSGAFMNPWDWRRRN